jgi:hypothetical protein
MAEQSATPSRLGRRGLIRGIGAGGLAAAAAVVVGQRPAEAAITPQQYLCCNLAEQPTFPYSVCRDHASYIWGCYSGSQFCQCCEWYRKNEKTISSISCYP